VTRAWAAPTAWSNHGRRWPPTPALASQSCDRRGSSSTLMLHYLSKRPMCGHGDSRPSVAFARLLLLLRILLRLSLSLRFSSRINFQHRSTPCQRRSPHNSSRSRSRSRSRSHSRSHSRSLFKRCRGHCISISARCQSHKPSTAGRRRRRLAALLSHQCNSHCSRRCHHSRRSRCSRCRLTRPSPSRNLRHSHSLFPRNGLRSMSAYSLELCLKLYGVMTLRVCSQRPCVATKLTRLCSLERSGIIYPKALGSVRANRACWRKHGDRCGWCCMPVC
jgi:hypothetical protein